MVNYVNKKPCNDNHRKWHFIRSIRLEAVASSIYSKLIPFAQ